VAVRASFCPAASSARARRASTSDCSCGVSREAKRTTRKSRAASANRPARYMLFPVSKKSRSKGGAGVASAAGPAGVGSGVAGSCAAARPVQPSHSAQKKGARREMPHVPRFHADWLRMRARMSCSSRSYRSRPEQASDRDAGQFIRFGGRAGGLVSSSCRKLWQRLDFWVQPVEAAIAPRDEKLASPCVGENRNRRKY